MRAPPAKSAAQTTSAFVELLTFGGFTPIVAIENETVSKPVPDKVMDDMRRCEAAVIHVGAEVKMMDPQSCP